MMIHASPVSESGQLERAVLAFVAALLYCTCVAVMLTSAQPTSRHACLFATSLQSLIRSDTAQQGIDLHSSLTGSTRLPGVDSSLEDPSSASLSAASAGSGRTIIFRYTFDHLLLPG